MNWQLLNTVATFALYVLILGVWKPWTKAYADEKGKNFARKEDLDTILAEVRAVTITQKEIEAKLNSDLWDRQMRRNEKKDLYGEILSTIHKMLGTTSTLRVISNMAATNLSEEERARLQQRSTATLVEFTAAENELIRLNGQASIFASPECSGRLSRFLTVQRGPDFLTTGGLQNFFGRLMDLNEQMIASAKDDLGITARA